MAVVGKADKVAKNFFQQNRCQAVNRRNTGEFNAERQSLAAKNRSERQRLAKSCRCGEPLCVPVTVIARERENSMQLVRFKFSFAPSNLMEYFSVNFLG